MDQLTLSPETEAPVAVAPSDASEAPLESPNEMTPVVLVRPRTVRLHCSAFSPNPFQPRRQFSEAYIAGLADSIYENGLMDEPLAREHPNEDGAFQLITGENRWRAIKLLELQGRGDGYADFKLREADDRTMLELALLENIQRRNLNALEEAWGFVELERMGLTQGQIGAKYGYSQPVVSNRIRLLGLPDAVQDAIRADNLSAGHGVALLALPKHERGGWAMRAMQEGIAVKTLEGLIRAHNEENQEANQKQLFEEPPTNLREDGTVARQGEPLVNTTTLPTIQPRATEMSDAELAAFNGEKSDEAEEESKPEAPAPQQLLATEAAEAPEEDGAPTETTSEADVPLSPTPEPMAQEATVAKEVASSPTVEPAMPQPAAPAGAMVMAPVPASEAAWLKEKGYTTGVALAHFRRFYGICEKAPNLAAMLQVDGLGGALDLLETLHAGGDN